MPQPGSHKYDTERARRRKRLENEGAANDQGAGERANRELREEGREARLRTERGLGPKGERESGR